MIKKSFDNKFLYLTLLVLAFLTMSLLIPFIPIGKLLYGIKEQKNLIMGIFTAITIFTTGIVMLLQFSIVYQIAKLNLNWKKVLLLMLSSIILIVITILWIHFSLNKMKPFPERYSYFEQVFIVIQNIGIIPLYQKSFYSLFIICLCTGFGALLSFIVREKNLLVPVMLCCALVDIWTVTLGFVSKTMQKAPEIIGSVSAGVPMVGSGKTFSSISTIGIGDFIFPALVFACVFRFGFNGKRNFWFMFSFLLIGMLLIILDIIPFLPALICVASAAIIANWKEFTLSRKEILYIAIVFLLLFFVLISFRFFMK